MNLDLNSIELRILGALIEKEITTPEYYPMSLNGLTAACNQKSNREPVMNLDETDVSIGIDSLRDKKLVWQLSTAGGRVPKYEHNFRSLFTFSKAETAVLCVLILRGAQTAGEIKSRTDRLYTFASLEEVEKTLRLLIEHSDGPFVKELPRQPGKKEPRFIHLFSTEILQNIEATASLAPEATTTRSVTGADRLAALEQEMKTLREEFEQLRDAFNQLKGQLE